MKHLLGIIAVCVGTQAMGMGSLPNGSWHGKGKCVQETGGATPYEEQLTIQDNVMTTILKVGEASMTYVLKFDFRPNDFATVEIHDPGKPAPDLASGYCAESWCHVQLGEKFELTIVFVEGRVYQLGSHDENGKRGWFESALELKAGAT